MVIRVPFNVSGAEDTSRTWRCLTARLSPAEKPVAPRVDPERLRLLTVRAHGVGPHIHLPVKSPPSR